MDRAEAWTADLLQVLQLSGVVLAALVVLGPVYLAKARCERDPQLRAQLFVTPEEWHSRALGVVPEVDANQRRSIEDAYKAALAAARQSQPPGV